MQFESISLEPRNLNTHGDQPYNPLPPSRVRGDRNAHFQKYLKSIFRLKKKIRVFKVYISIVSKAKGPKAGLYGESFAVRDFTAVDLTFVRNNFNLILN